MSAYAQDYGYFFNSNSGDRKYSADSFETWLKPFFVSGVFEGGLKVKAQTTPDMTVQVEAGYANLDGKLAFWPSANNMTLAAAPGIYSRIDTIVLRRDNVNRRVSIEVVTGTASSSPVPTAPMRDSDTYELVIAQILVGTGVTAINTADITDTRIDTDICGYVCAAVQTPSFQDLYDQFTAQFGIWFDHMKDQLDEDAAGHLQLEVDDIQAMIAEPYDPTKVYKGGELCSYECGLWRRKAWTGSGEPWTPSHWDAVTVDEYISDIDDIEKSLALVVDGDTSTRDIPSGRYLFIKNNTSLVNGYYRATTNITSGTSITSVNTAVEQYGVGGALETVKQNITSRVDGVEEDVDALETDVSSLLTYSMRYKSYSVPTSGKTLTLKGGVRGFIYIPASNASGQFGLYMFTGGSTSAYIREIAASSYIGITTSSGSFVFTNSSSGDRTVYFISVGAYGNLPD